MIVTEPRKRSLNGTTQAGPDLMRAIRDYVRAYERRHGRRKTTDDLSVSRHTLWRFLERGHAGRAVPAAVLNAVGGSIAALEAATLEIIIDLEGLRPDPALRHLRQGIECQWRRHVGPLVCSCSAKKSELSGQHKCPHHLLREMACLRVGQQRTGRKVLMQPILREACLEFGRQLPLCYA